MTTCVSAITDEQVEIAAQAMAITIARQDGVTLTPAAFRHGAEVRPHEHARMREYVRAGLEAALAAAPAGAVKALEWTGNEGGPGCDLLATPDQFHSYTVRHLSADTFDVILNTDTGPMWFRERGETHSTYKSAKSAAQADYERRIRSALTSPGSQATDVPAIIDHVKKYNVKEGDPRRLYTQAQIETAIRLAAAPTPKAEGAR